MKKALLFCLIITLNMSNALSVHAQSGVVTTVAGCFTCIGTPVDGVTASMADFLGTRGIGIDAARNIYVGDSGRHKIRRVLVSDGNIYTVVGDGTAGFSGDGGPATAARLNNPGGIFINAANDLFISDDNNNRVRKVDGTTGIITTIAGGGVSIADGIPATNASINPLCVYADAAGNIYTGGMNVLRKVDPSGIINTIAGNGSSINSGDGGPALSAGIAGSPRCITMDGTGNIYFIPGSGDRIRKIDAGTGIITTVAGGGGSLADGIPAITASLNNMYGCGIDAAGNIIVGDRGSNRIRLVDAVTGIITTIAGGCTSTASGIPALRARADHYMLLVDDIGGNVYYTNNSTVARKFTYSTTGMIPIGGDSMTVLVNTLCSGPELSVTTNHFYSGMTVETYFGDGQSAITPIANGCGIGYTVINHTYNYSGTYSIKQVLYLGTVALDSFQRTYTHNMCNSVQINFYFDLDADCKNNNLDVASTQPILTQIDSAGVIIDTVSSTSGFYYNAYGNPGTIYQYKIISLHPNYSYACPLTGIISDTLSLSTSYNNKKIDLGLNCSSGSIDNSINAVTVRARRNSQSGIIFLSSSNCAVTTATVTLTLSPKYLSQQFTQVITPFSNGSPVRSGYSMSPAVLLNVGDTVHTHVSITPNTGDSNPMDNNYIVIDTVIASHDPNIITVNPAGYIPAGTLLEYMIEFENTGNDTAFNIFVLDTLSEHVAFESFKALSASAKMITTRAKMGAYNVLKFDFPGINLLDSSHHDLCHGMLKYTIRAKTDLPFGTLIHNSASIYFDYNEPVKTNTVTNIIGTPTAVAEVANEPVVVVYPNPANNELTITADKQYTSYTVTNTMGQQMMQQPINASQTKVNIKALPAGLYYINLKGEQGSTVRKFVKL